MHLSRPPIALDAALWAEAPDTALNALRSQQTGDIRLDATGDDPITAQVAQLLLAAQAAASARGAVLRLERPSPSVVESLAALGLGDLLQGGQA